MFSMIKEKKFMLVYQKDKANIFEVERFDVFNPYLRKATIRFDSEWDMAAGVAVGLFMGGHDIKVAVCSSTSKDIADEPWSVNFKKFPNYQKMIDPSFFDSINR